MQRAPSGSGDHALDCLSRVARILVLCGHSPKDLVRKLQAACRVLPEPTFGWDPERLHFIADLPHVISLWYSDPLYLAAKGEPAALPVSGRGATLASLIKRVLPHEDPRAVARALIEMRAIRAQGTRYLPNDKHVGFRDETARLYSLSVLLRILGTIERNITGAKGTAITERHAIHPSFPVAALPGAHRQLKARAAEFLWGADNAMRRLERRYRYGQRVRLGVEVFAFEEPLSEGRGRRRSHPNGRSLPSRKRSSKR
jgi:hypothetical protein